MAFCARLNFAADTIFIAEVICWVELTEPIRVLTSFRFAITILRYFVSGLPGKHLFLVLPLVPYVF